MPRPKRTIVSRSLEYNNGMLHEEEVALRRALHASLVASKTLDDEEDLKETKAKHLNKDVPSANANLANNKKLRTKSNTESVESKEHARKNKRKSDEMQDTGDRKRQKKLLVQIKSKPRREKSVNASKDVVKKKDVKSRTFKLKKKTTVKESEVKVVKRRRRRKKNVDEMKHNADVKTTESLPKVQVQRKFAQTFPASPRSLLLYQSQMQPMKARAKTEDFLDYLCLRGSTRMPKTLEMFNNPCAPVSPLTDEDESSKISPKTSASEKTDNEPDAKRSLVLQLEGDESSCYAMSSSVSTRVQSHVVLPQFTNNHSVLTHIPIPIPYPTAPTQPGFDVYGALSTTTAVTPSLVPNSPRVSSVAMETCVAPLRDVGEKQGFHPVGQTKDRTAGSSPPKRSENLGKTAKSKKLTPNKTKGDTQDKSPSKRKDTDQGKSQSKNRNNEGKSPAKRQDTGQSKSPGKREDTEQGKSPRKRRNDNEDKSPAKRQNSPNKSPKKSPTKVLGKKTASQKKLLNSEGKIKEKTSKNVKTDLPGSVSEGQPDDTIKDLPSLNNVPVFSPTETEFKNPLKYIESIKAKAEPFGICVVVPPKIWQPEYCLSDEIRFTTKLQRIHCLGNNYPIVEYELAAIRKHREQQSIFLSTMPQIAGCEVDLPFMAKVVEEFGGLQQIIDKRKWGKVADKLRIPKTAADRATKLEHIYCKYLLSYDLLSEEEKTKLRNDVLEEQNKKSGLLKKFGEAYTTKGRSMSLAIFQRNAKNISEYYIKPAMVNNIEQVFWQMIDEGERYVVVHAAELDRTAFPTSKTKLFSKSKWNLNVLPKTPGSLARDLPELEGITSPVVKVEMVLSAEPWHTPAHDLYTVEYLHHGEDKIWYSVPSCSKDRFLEVITAELNGDVGDMKDRVIHHSLLAKSGISVFKVVQEAGQFIVKFPGAHHSSLSTGFAVSEFVSFAPMSYLPQIKTTFQGDLKSEVDHSFSWGSLIVSSVKEELRRNSNEDTLSILIPELKELRDVETRLRNELATLGVVEKSESENTPDKKSRSRRVDSDEIENCYECNRFCFPSVIMDQSDTPYALCLHHGLEKRKQDETNDLTIASLLSLSDLNDLVKEIEEKLEQVRSTPAKVRKRQGGANTSSNNVQREASTSSNNVQREASTSSNNVQKGESSSNGGNNVDK